MISGEQGRVEEWKRGRTEDGKTGKREDAKAPEGRQVYSRSGITTGVSPRGDQPTGQGGR